MPNKIDSSLTPYRQIKGAGDSNRTSEKASTTAAADTSATPSSEDTVEVTGFARQMASLEAAIAKSSGVDEARVEAIRAQVADGTYAIAPQKIADALMRMDQVIAAGS